MDIDKDGAAVLANAPKNVLRSGHRSFRTFLDLVENACTVIGMNKEQPIFSGLKFLRAIAKHFGEAVVRILESTILNDVHSHVRNVSQGAQ
jgi:hypothetical protein